MSSAIREEIYRDETGDPWNGRTLEWSTPSPPPFYNFAIIPHVHDQDPFWAMKHGSHGEGKPRYEQIHMPKNTAIGVYIGAFSFLFGFAAIWQILWLAIVGFIGIMGKPDCSPFRSVDQHLCRRRRDRENRRRERPRMSEHEHHADLHFIEVSKNTIFGFWVYLMTDAILFATLFATYAVLHDNTFGGPSARELFSLPHALGETIVLLASSLTCALAMVAVSKSDKTKTIGWYGATSYWNLLFGDGRNRVRPSHREWQRLG